MSRIPFRFKLLSEVRQRAEFARLRELEGSLQNRGLIAHFELRGMLAAMPMFIIMIQSPSVVFR